jgi:hypothetical protein
MPDWPVPQPSGPDDPSPQGAAYEGSFGYPGEPGGYPEDGSLAGFTYPASRGQAPQIVTGDDDDGERGWGTSDLQPPFLQGGSPYGDPPPPPGRGRAGWRGVPQGRTRLILVCAAVVAVVAGALTAGFALRPHASAGAQAAHPRTARPSAAAAAPAALPPAISLAAARQVLASYITRNNTANTTRSDTGLAAIEGDSALRLDEGGYQFENGQVANGTASGAYSPITDEQPSFCIPRLASTAWPKWFVTEGTWAGQIPGSGFRPVHEYDVFAQARPGAAWLVVSEPDITGAVPAISTSAGGYATALSPAAMNGLRVIPSSLPQATVAALNGNFATQTVTGLTSPQDQKDESFWSKELPAGADVTVTRSVGSDPLYALRLQDGGALVFYAARATLTLTGPALRPMAVEIPGYYSPSHPVTAASVPYEEEFAAVDPARPGTAVTAPNVVAQLSGIAARG